MTIKVTIELPDTVTVSANGYETEFAWAKIPADSLAEFVATAACVGIAKAGNDSASGAKAYAEKNKLADNTAAAQELIDGWIAARYKSGELGRVAGTGSGYTTLDRKAFSLKFFKVPGVADTLSVRYIVRTRNPEKYKGMADAEFQTYCAEFIAGALDEKTRKALYAAAQAKLDEEMAEAARMAEAAVEIELD